MGEGVGVGHCVPCLGVGVGHGVPCVGVGVGHCVPCVGVEGVRRQVTSDVGQHHIIFSFHCESTVTHGCILRENLGTLRSTLGQLFMHAPEKNSAHAPVSAFSSNGSDRALCACAR